MMSRRDLLTASAAGIAVGTTGLAPFGFAQPGMKTTRILVGFPAGGTVDFVARLLANEIRDHSSAVVVENRSGAGGRVALEGLKSSVADGSTMILTPAATMVVYPHIYNALKYDAFADFAPVTKICDFPYLLAIGPMVPGRVETLADLLPGVERTRAGRRTGRPVRELRFISPVSCWLALPVSNLLTFRIRGRRLPFKIFWEAKSLRPFSRSTTRSRISNREMCEYSRRPVRGEALGFPNCRPSKRPDILRLNFSTGWVSSFQRGHPAKRSTISTVLSAMRCREERPRPR